MHEMVIDSIRVSMQNYQRVVILRAKGSDSYLPIWIGPNEADSIALKLQEVSVPRPLTHDLLGSVIDNLGASVDHIVVSDLTDDTFYAKIVLTHNGGKLEVDSRPSDAIALAVRSESPIYAEESVLKKGGVQMDMETGKAVVTGREQQPAAPVTADEVSRMSAFEPFLSTLNMDLGEKVNLENLAEGEQDQEPTG